MISAYLLGVVNTGPIGLEEMTQLLSKREVQALASRLALFMAHLLHWKTQPPGTTSWCQTSTTQGMYGKRHIPGQN
jgi:hypothetical protein